MNAHPIIQIGEDNSPFLRELETPAGRQPSRQFACQPEPGRYYFVNLAAYRPCHAELIRPDDGEVNTAIASIAATINRGGIPEIEEADSGNPTRDLELRLPQTRHAFLVRVGVLTDSPPGIHTPSDPELHQLFAFLSRCHPLG